MPATSHTNRKKNHIVIDSDSESSEFYINFEAYFVWGRGVWEYFVWGRGVWEYVPLFANAKLHPTIITIEIDNTTKWMKIK